MLHKILLCSISDNSNVLFPGGVYSFFYLLFIMYFLFLSNLNVIFLLFKATDLNGWMNNFCIPYKSQCDG